MFFYSIFPRKKIDFFKKFDFTAKKFLFGIRKSVMSKDLTKKTAPI